MGSKGSPLGAVDEVSERGYLTLVIAGLEYKMKKNSALILVCVPFLL